MSSNCSQGMRRRLAAAVQQQPGVDRLKYQLARAYQTIDLEEAMPLYAELVERKYAAAFVLQLGVVEAAGKQPKLR